MDVIKEKNIGDYTIKIEYDQDAIDPRRDMGYTMQMLSGSRTYNFGEHQALQSRYPEATSVKEFFLYFVNDHFNLNYNENTDTFLGRLEKWADKNLVYFPLYKYEHVDIQLSIKPFNSRFDSGQLGMMFETKDELKKELGVSRLSSLKLEEIEERVKQELDLYSQYINGHVYTYVIEKDDEFVDSCSGFYDIDDAMNCAMEELESYLPSIKYYKAIDRNTAWISMEDCMKEYKIKEEDIEVLYTDDLSNLLFYGPIHSYAKYVKENSNEGDTITFNLTNRGNIEKLEITNLKDNIHIDFYNDQLEKTRERDYKKTDPLLMNESEKQNQKTRKPKLKEKEEIYIDQEMIF